jgi:hypothetical protein
MVKKNNPAPNRPQPFVPPALPREVQELLKSLMHELQKNPHFAKAQEALKNIPSSAFQSQKFFQRQEEREAQQQKSPRRRAGGRPPVAQIRENAEAAREALKGAERTNAKVRSSDEKKIDFVFKWFERKGSDARQEPQGHGQAPHH